MGIAYRDEEALPIEVDYTSSAAAIILRLIRHLGSGDFRDTSLLYLSLGLHPGRCLEDVFLERERQGQSGSCREPVLSHELWQHATIASCRSTQAYDLEVCSRATHLTGLVTSHPVAVGDIVFSAFNLPFPWRPLVVVLCRGDLANAHSSAEQLDHEEAIVAIGYVVESRICLDPQLHPRWYDYRMDGKVVGKREQQGYTYTLMLSAVDMAVLHAVAE